ncbi:MAG: hypothetical protein RBR71_12520 [Gudongella sp.]|nr:hypothetical protein [Gudongella sp.]
MIASVKGRVFALAKSLAVRARNDVFLHAYFKFKSLEWTDLYLRAAAGSERMIYICPYKGTGDVYLALSLLCGILKERRDETATVCVIGAACARIAALFGFSNIVSFEQKEMDDIMLMGTVCGFGRLNMFVLHADPPNSKMGISDRMRNYNGLNYRDMYSYGVFGMGPELEAVVPGFRPFDESVAEYFRSNRLKPGRTVIVAPSVKTLGRLPEWFWIELAARLGQAGYSVCTNCGDDEDPVAGSVRLSVPYGMMKAYYEYAGHVISSRSGLCDVFSSFDMCKIVIYQPNVFWGSSGAMEYFSLNRMRLCDDAIEIRYQGIEFLELMDTVMLSLADWERRNQGRQHGTYARYYV